MSHLRALATACLAFFAFGCSSAGPSASQTKSHSAELGPEGDRFGVGLGGLHASGPHLLDGDADRIFYEVRNGLGVGWIRIEAGWGNMSHHLLGHIVAKARAEGLRVIVVLQPNLAIGPPTDTEINDYLTNRLEPMLASAFSSNDARPDAIEVGNELNGTAWNGNMSAWLARRTKERLLASPSWSQIQVISGGTLNTYARENNGEQIWFNEFFGSGAFCTDQTCSSRYMPFDYMAVHPYNPHGSRISNACINSGAPQCFETWKSELSADLNYIRNRLRDASGQWSELWVTEFGWQSPPNGWNQPCPDDVATYHNCVRTEDQLRAAMQASYEAFHDPGSWEWHTRAALWHEYRDEADPNAPGKHFGVRDRQHVTKSAVWQKLRGLAGTPSWGDPEATWNGSRFVDVEPSSFSHGYIERLSADFILDGRPDRTLAPGAAVSRGEFALLLGRALTYNDWRGSRYCSWQISSTETSPFDDLPPTDHRFQYVMTLVEAGVIDGYGDHTFRPDAPLTRAQAAKLVTVANRWPPSYPPSPSYSDVAPSDWAYPYVEAVTQHGLFAGYSDGTFRPGNAITRAQAAKVMHENFVVRQTCGAQR